VYDAPQASDLTSLWLVPPVVVNVSDMELYATSVRLMRDVAASFVVWLNVTLRGLEVQACTPLGERLSIRAGTLSELFVTVWFE
jgi:hypothetical protein